MSMKERLQRAADGKFKSTTSAERAVAEPDPGPPPAGDGLEVKPAKAALASSASQAGELDATTKALLDETAPVVKKPVKKPVTVTAKPVKASPAPASSRGGGNVLALIGGACAAVLLGVMGYQVVKGMQPKPAPIMPPDKATQPMQPAKAPAPQYMEV
jgi:hypothetical protein